MTLSLDNIKKIHFIGIAGIAMSAIAVELKRNGFIITGSDTKVSDPSKSFLEKNGLFKKEGFSKDKIADDIDLVIVSGQIIPTNEEVVEAIHKKIKVISYPELLASLIKKYNTICVTGTYGKTTITAMISWIMEYSAAKTNSKTNSKTPDYPSYLIGGKCKNLETNFRLLNSNYFVVEGDEYHSSFFDSTPKFMYYGHDITVLTGIEYDHVNVFKTENDYFNVFKDLLKNIYSSDSISSLIACGDSTDIRKLLNGRKNVSYYGLSEKNNFYAKNIKYNPITSFDVFHNNSFLFRVESNMIGEHNILNSLAAISACLQTGISMQNIVSALKNFKGIARRQEILYDNQTVIIDDNAHHPTKVRETIKGIKFKYPAKKLLVIFNPCTQSSLTKSYVKTYKHSFEYSDELILIPPNPIKRLKNFQYASLQDYLKCIKYPKRICAVELIELKSFLMANKTLFHNSVVLFLSANNISDTITDCINIIKKDK